MRVSWTCFCGASQPVERDDPDELMDDVAASLEEHFRDAHRDLYDPPDLTPADELLEPQAVADDGDQFLPEQPSA